MTYEIVFDSATGNTKLLAEKIKESMERGNVPISAAQRRLLHSLN